MDCSIKSAKTIAFALSLIIAVDKKRCFWVPLGVMKSEFGTKTDRRKAKLASLKKKQYLCMQFNI